MTAIDTHFHGRLLPEELDWTMKANPSITDAHIRIYEAEEIKARVPVQTPGDQ